MLGMIARARSRDSRLHRSELEAAMWFSKDKALMMQVGTHPDGLHTTGGHAIVHQLIAMVLAALRARLRFRPND
jgi:NADH pyrophosphatase NudC (nudix superfamily)